MSVFNGAARQILVRTSSHAANVIAVQSTSKAAQNKRSKVQAACVQAGTQCDSKDKHGIWALMVLGCANREKE